MNYLLHIFLILYTICEKILTSPLGLVVTETARLSHENEPNRPFRL